MSRPASYSNTLAANLTLSVTAAALLCAAGLWSTAPVHPMTGVQELQAFDMAQTDMAQTGTGGPAIWDLELIFGEDIDGDGHIGPPPSGSTSAITA